MLVNNNILFKLFKVDPREGFNDLNLRNGYNKLMKKYHPDKWEKDCSKEDYLEISKAVTRARGLLNNEEFRTAYNRRGNNGVDEPESTWSLINKAVNLISRDQGTYEPEVITISDSSDSDNDDEPQIIGYSSSKRKYREEIDDEGDLVMTDPDLRITKHRIHSNNIKFKITHKRTHTKAWKDLDDMVFISELRMLLIKYLKKLAKNRPETLKKLAKVSEISKILKNLNKQK